MSRPRAVDDFTTIRADAKELPRETLSFAADPEGRRTASSVIAGLASAAGAFS
jgi:hypothetical protein